MIFVRPSHRSLRQLGPLIMHLVESNGAVLRSELIVPNIVEQVLRDDGGVDVRVKTTHANVSPHVQTADYIDVMAGDVLLTRTWFATPHTLAPGDNISVDYHFSLQEWAVREVRLA